MTDVRITQQGVETWVVNNPQARITQQGVETWVLNNPQMRVTQMGLEVWRSVAVAVVVPSSTQPIVMILT